MENNDSFTLVAHSILRARSVAKQEASGPLASALASPEEAYKVQDIVRKALGDDSLVPKYWKSGGPSRTSSITHAPLLPHGVTSSPADMRDRQFHNCMIEAEVALRLGKDVTAALANKISRTDADKLVEAMTVAIEIVDSRWKEAGDAPQLLKLADLVSHGALVVGEWQPYSRRAWDKELCSVQIGNNPTWASWGSHPLKDPTWHLVDWLRHVTRHGHTLPAGTVVTTGSWCGMMPASEGDLVEATFESVGVARVQL